MPHNHNYTEPGCPSGLRGWTRVPASGGTGDPLPPRGRAGSNPAPGATPILFSSLSVIRKFDPWNSPLCTCPFKLTLNPYTGCGHGCIYCYARGYIPNFDKPRLKENLLTRVLKDLDRIPRGTLISMSESSDPYQPLEETYRLTRKVLKLLLRRGMKVLIVTKSDLVVNDVDILDPHSVAVSITITTLDDDLAKLLEPGAPPPSRRLEAVVRLSSEGFRVTVRVDPIIPELNDSPKEIEDLIKASAEAGARHIVSSTLKVKPHVMSGLSKVFPQLKQKFIKLYYEEGTRIQGYRYLPSDLRLKYMELVARLSRKYGMSFSTCREGLEHLNTPGIPCDGRLP